MAARFWVGGTGTWDASDTTHWASSSGGAGGQSVPGSGDTVTLDGSSGGGTITVAYDPTVTSITMGAFTGTLDMNTRNPTMQTFNGSGTGVRTLTMGSGIWTITGSNANIFTLSTSTNLTFTASTATVLCTYSGGTGTRVFIVPAINFCKISVSAGTDIFYIQMTTGGTIGTIDFTGFTGVLQGGGGSGLDLVGDLILGAGMTTAAVDLTHPYVFKGTSLQTITSNGVILNHGVTISGGSASVILADALNLGTSSITLNGVTFNTNNQSVTAAGLISSNTNTRTLTLGSSNLTFTASAAGTVFAFTISTNLTITANTATINLTGTGIDFDEGAINWNGASLNLPGQGACIMRGSGTFANITRTGTANIDDSFSLANNHTVTGTFTINGNSNKNRLRVQSNQSGTLASTRVITAANVVASYVNLIDIQGAGAGSWDFSAITGLAGDGGGNVNITFVAPVTLYWFQDSGSWSDSSKWFLGTGGTGGAGRVPLLHDTAVFDANSFTATGRTITADMTGYSGINWMTTATAGQNFTFPAATTVRFYKSLVLGTNTTVGTSTTTFVFTGRAANTITSNGSTFAGNISIQAVGNSITLLDWLRQAVTQTFTVFSGTFNGGSANLTTGIFNSNGTATRAVNLGSGQYFIGSGGGGTVWDFGTTTSLTFDAGTSEVIITDTSAATKSLNFANATIAFNVLTIPASGAGVIRFTNTSGTRDINMLRVYGTNTLSFSAGQTYEIRSFDIPGTFGTVTFVSGTPTSQYTLSNVGGLVRLFNVNITDAIGAGGAYWQAINSTNGGNNTNINFVTATTGGGLQVGKKFARFGGARAINEVMDSKLHGYRKLGG